MNEIHNISHFNAALYDSFNSNYNLEAKKGLIEMFREQNPYIID